MSDDSFSKLIGPGKYDERWRSAIRIPILILAIGMTIALGVLVILWAGPIVVGVLTGTGEIADWPWAT